MMYKSSDNLWKIVIPEKIEGMLKTFSPEEVIIKTGKSLDYKSNPLMEKYVEDRWNAHVKEKEDKGFPAPVNGNLIRVSTMPFVNSQGEIELHLAPSNYKEHIATNFPKEEFSKEFVRKHPEYEFSQMLTFDQNANNLSNLGILTTADNYLVYTIRSAKTATFAGLISGFGKVLNSVETMRKDGPNHLFDILRDSVFDETGMSQQPKAEKLKHDLTLNLGGYSYLTDGIYTPLFVVNTKLEKGDLEEMTKKSSAKIGNSNQKKFVGFGFVPIEEDSYLEFLRNPNLVPTIKPIWNYLAVQRFGLDYIKSV